MSRSIGLAICDQLPPEIQCIIIDYVALMDRKEWHEKIRLVNQSYSATWKVKEYLGQEIYLRYIVNIGNTGIWYDAMANYRFLEYKNFGYRDIHCFKTLKYIHPIPMNY